MSASLESLLETERFPNIAALYSYGTNFDPDQDPFRHLLNLTGWSYEHLGGFALEVKETVDYTAMDYLAGSLLEVATSGEDAHAFIHSLMTAETE